MADKKKYLDFEGLGFYHQKSQEIVDKKINWDNLKNRPFGISTTDVLYTGGTPESKWTDLDYEGLGFGNYDLDTKFTFRVNGEEPPQSMEFFSEMYEGSYIVYTYGTNEFLDTPDPVNDSLIALRWNKIEGEEYARIKLPNYQSINNFEIIVKGLDKEIIKKIDKKYLPLEEVELGDLKIDTISESEIDDLFQES